MKLVEMIVISVYVIVAIVAPIIFAMIGILK